MIPDYVDGPNKITWTLKNEDTRVSQRDVPRTIEAAVEIQSMKGTPTTTARFQMEENGHASRTTEAKKSPQFTASKKMGTSVLHPQETKFC